MLLATACTTSISGGGEQGGGAEASTPASTTSSTSVSGAGGSSSSLSLQGSTASGSGGSASGSAGGEASTSSGGADLTAYDGHGFIVHEWGTDTVVVGSDGSLQRGLHHEEEDLPAFVNDRMTAGLAMGSTSVHVKMETPVTYFYAPAPLTAKVSVAFPAGVFTQWYPAVNRFFPWVAAANASFDQPEPSDPVFDLDFPFSSPECAAKQSKVANGLLDWDTVEVLDRGAKPGLPDAPLAKYTWSHAREVASNPLRVAGAPGSSGPEAEKFLFYRGLGNFDLPVSVRAKAAGALELENVGEAPVGHVFVIHVNEAHGAFTEHATGVAPGATLAAAAPALEGAPKIDDFVVSLGTAVEGALGSTGLYADEASSMVRTWSRQWFRTPGVRVLYLAPQSWTDASIPLSIEPKPDATIRVMMIRVEVLTPDLEATDVAAASNLADPTTEADAKAHFIALGRFAEPRLRRALSMLGSPAYGDALLATVASADTRGATGE